jgi:hypothetical protein
MSRWASAVAGCFFAVACGGSFASNDSTPPPDGGTGGSDGNATGGGSSGTSATGGSSSGAAGNDAGSTSPPIPVCMPGQSFATGSHYCYCAGAGTNGMYMYVCTPVGGTGGMGGGPSDASLMGRVPQNHRPSSKACPIDRPPGFVDPVCSMSGGIDQCKTDQDCTNGKNGRCYTNSGGARCLGNTCSYDGCFGDGDCQGNVPCECRASEAHGANICVGNSNCRVDADCGPGGFCSRSGVSNCSFGYFCHTPSDECVDDADCKNAAGFSPVCAYDRMLAHWRCLNPCLPVP